MKRFAREVGIFFGCVVIGAVVMFALQWLFGH